MMSESTNNNPKIYDNQNRKLIILLGAGATYSDSENQPDETRPPLDKGFFKNANFSHKNDVKKINRYMQEIYDIDILSHEQDSLEKIMATIYTDISNPKLGARAFKIFKILILLFNKRLAKTTNQIKTVSSLNLNKIISNYLSQGLNSNNITIITFNQDLQIEKILSHISNLKQWKDRKIFGFPSCYRLGIMSDNVIRTHSDTEEKNSN